MLLTKSFLALALSILPLSVLSLSIVAASELETRSHLFQRDNSTSSSDSSNVTQVTTAPTPPSFKWLYTVFAYCPANVAPALAGPYGVRKVIPITGGVIQGPYFNGTLRNLGADWGLVDAQTGVFSADTRYEGVTDKGDELYFQTSGPGQVGGGLHLRIKVETSSRELYWLNEIVAVGELKNVGTTTHLNETVSILRIDAFNFANDRNQSMFLNSTNTSS
ncbi:uncharacterized protein JCM15063_002818 [Sporobolomyces koalae]|uniref:uncharacterized protein n=1 Tax=Sporobolomyces koalae TaxID=500713 RepID=UPI0031827584